MSTSHGAVAATVEQSTLFELGPDLEPIRAAQEELMETDLSPNTRKAYRKGYKIFDEWCLAHGRTALPASEETVCLFVAWSVYQREPRYRLKTVRVNLAAIRIEHEERGLPSPLTQEVRVLMRRASRKLRERQQHKNALTPELLRLLGGSLSKGLPSNVDVRDHAMFVVTFGLGWRRSEIASLDFEDVIVSEDRVQLTLGASKTDQGNQEGRLVILPRGQNPLTCPVRTLSAWLERRGDWPGPLFCHSNAKDQIVRKRLAQGRQIALRLAKRLQGIGVDAKRYGAHSLRAGMITSSAENGADVVAIMQRTGHANVATVLKYVRPAQAFRADPLAGVL